MLPTYADTNTAHAGSCSVAPRFGSGRRWGVARETAGASPRGEQPANRAGRIACPLV